MNFTEALQSAFNKYAVIQGRASRDEFVKVKPIQATIIATALAAKFISQFELMMVCLVLYLITCLPMTGLTCRRLHDIGASHWLVFLEHTIIGYLIIFAMCMQPSDPNDNQYGKSLTKPTQEQTPEDKKKSPGKSISIVCFRGVSPIYMQKFAVTEIPRIIGRDTGSDIITVNASNILFPGGTYGVSHVHCQIQLVNGKVMLTDKGSRFGTYIKDNVKLEEDKPVYLEPGDIFYLGSNNIGFEVKIEESPS